MRVLGTILNAIATRREERCRRGGHALRRPATHRFFEWPGTGSAVADQVVMEERTCKCGRERSEVLIERMHLTGLTMSSEDWTKLRRDGILERP